MTPTTPTPDPHTLPPDPRLPSPSTYSRSTAIAAITALYTSLPHLPPSSIEFPPPTGWPEITSSSLAARGLHKTPEAVQLLRHLPYLAGARPWVAPDAFALDYRRVVAEGGRGLFVWELAGYEESAGVPGWVVQITTGWDQLLAAYLLDTSDGTLSCYRHVVMYPSPSSLYPAADPRAWRNACEERTCPVEEALGEWRAKYRKGEWLGVPGGMKWPGVLLYGGEPDGFLSEECIAIRRIYQEHGWPDEYRGDEARVVVQGYWDGKHNTPRLPPPSSGGAE